MAEYFHAILTCAVDRDKWSASRRGGFTYVLMGGSVCPRADLNPVEEEKHLSLPEVKPRFLDHTACCLITILVHLSGFHQDFNSSLMPRSSSQLCCLPRKFSVIYLGGKSLQTYGLQMTELAVKICGFYICDREIGSAANAAQWWWYGALGVVHWSAEARQGSLPLGTGRGDSNAAFKDWYQLSDPLRSFIYRRRMSCEGQHPLWHNL